MNTTDIQHLRRFKKLFSCLALSVAFLPISCNHADPLEKEFRNPPNKYRPMPFWHLNGHLTKEGINERISNAKSLCGFGGVAVLPVSPGPHYTNGKTCPGMTPAYLSDEYFERYDDMLRKSEELGTEIILYDDIDFPSGSAGGKLVRDYPEYTRKYLLKDEIDVQGKKHVKYECPNDPNKIMMTASALNMDTKEVIDLAQYVNGWTIEWDAPEGNWKILVFSYRANYDRTLSGLVDYMEPAAVSKFLEMTYEEYAKRYSNYFGNVITKIFFDDVGFVHQENTWNPEITRLFAQRTGKNPALYYPALYYDIGPETQAARVAFFDIRSELMAEGYPKQVAQWCKEHNLSSIGHPPENYSPNSVVANGDILKYYRHTQIPLLDAIFFYGRGVHGFKQISSAADLGDKPVVGAELCGAFPADMDSLTLFRTVYDAMARGVNFVVPHGMWYDTDPEKIRIPPLISHENNRIAASLPKYSETVARSCLLLQGGKKVIDVAVLWPITAIQGGTTINRDATSGLPVANWLPEHVNHHIISDLLSNRVHRDFTFVHPEDFCNGKLSIADGELHLNNVENKQDYKVLIVPGGDVISAATLQAINEFYKQGGKVIFTASLPFRSAEFGKDAEVCRLIQEMLGVAPGASSTNTEIVRKEGKGTLLFLPNTTAESLAAAFTDLQIPADVCFEEGTVPESSVGFVNYLHKQKEGKEIFYFTNTTDKEVNGNVSLRGEWKELQLWNPQTGNIESIKAQTDGSRTTIQLSLPAVSSTFVIAHQN